MQAEALFRIILDATSEKKAGSILKRLQNVLPIKVDNLGPYHKGGFEANARLAIEGRDWRDIAFNFISAAQRIGHGWSLSGDISDNVDMTCNHLTEPGVEFVWAHIYRSESS